MITYIVILFFLWLFFGWGGLLALLGMFVVGCFFVACFPNYFDDWKW